MHRVVACHHSGGDLAGRYVQRRDQRRGAVTDVLELASLGLAGLNTLRVRVVEHGDLGHHAADARQVRRPIVEFAGQCCGVGGKIPQRVRGCLGIDDGRRAAVAQVVSHDVTSAARESLAERVGPRKHSRAACEQNQRRRRLAEVLDAERDAIGLDRRHEAGAGAMVPSGVRGGRTVGCMSTHRTAALPP